MFCAVSSSWCRRKTAPYRTTCGWFNEAASGKRQGNQVVGGGLKKRHSEFHCVLHEASQNLKRKLRHSQSRDKGEARQA
jgi:hypothetical protein